MMFFNIGGGYQDEDDISAEEMLQKESAWLQKKNEYSRRKKSIGCKKIKRKKEIISIGHSFCGLFFFLSKNEKEWNH